MLESMNSLCPYASLGMIQTLYRSGLHFREGTDFDGAVERVGYLCSQFDSFIQVLAVEDVSSGKLFLRFGEWAIDDQRFALADADGPGCAGWLQRRSSHQDASLHRLLSKCAMALHDGFALLACHVRVVCLASAAFLKGDKKKGGNSGDDPWEDVPT